NLAGGKCSRAYGMVTSFTKEYFLSYRSLESFRESVCEPARENYEKVYVHEIDEMVADADSVTVYFRLRYKTTWMPSAQDRSMHFRLKRSGKRWLIDGPTLEI
ncbi:hypothetical protein ACFLQK_02740, partial [bacterium]